MGPYLLEVVLGGITSDVQAEIPLTMVRMIPLHDGVILITVGQAYSRSRLLYRWRIYYRTVVEQQRWWLPY